MSLVRSLANPRAGLGAVAGRGGRVAGLGSMGAALVHPFTDTGGGITPDNFRANCCTSWMWDAFRSYDHSDSGDACDVFKEANISAFGGNRPCSDAGLLALTTPPVVRTMEAPGPPVIDSTPGLAPGNDVWSPEYSPETPACNGRKVVTAQDVELLVTCLAQRQARAQAAAVMAAMSESAAGQCVAIKAECANRAFAAFLSPSADCTECDFDWTKPGSLFLVGGGLLLGGLLLVKLLK